MNTYYAFIIAATLIGFCSLAYVLLAPIWRFLDREEEASERWTKEALARRRRRQGNGTHGADEEDRKADGGDRAHPHGDGAPREET